MKKKKINHNNKEKSLWHHRRLVGMCVCVNLASMQHVIRDLSPARVSTILNVGVTFQLGMRIRIRV